MIAFVRNGALVARRLDLKRRELTGDLVTVADPIGYDLGFLLGGFSISADGLVAYRPSSAAGRQLTWKDRKGKAVAVAGDVDTNYPGTPELSPDGRRLAFRRIVQNNMDVWLMDLDRGSLTRFTVDPQQARGVGTGRNLLPVWSHDDVPRIAFASDHRDGVVNLYVKSSTGTAAEELLLKTSHDKAPQDWSHDGRFLLYVESDPKTGSDLWALDMSGSEWKRRPVANTAFEERNGQFSPDGRFVVYETNEAGRFEIMLQPFPEPTRKWQVSTSGGIAPRWRPDGKELYFIAPDAKLMAAPIALTAQAAEVGIPVALFSTSIVASGVANSFKHEYAVSPDGRFLINQPSDESTTAPIVLIVNWTPRPGI